MAEKEQSKHTLTSFLLNLTGILFVILKLVGRIDWSWVIVTLPLWGGVALMLGLISLVNSGTFIMKIRNRIKRRKL